MTTLNAVSIPPDDLLGAARTIPLGEISTCDWLGRWISAATFVEWATRGLSDADAYGLSNAVSYAKRAAACRIDVLVNYNHLIPLTRMNYPTKIDGLRKIGLVIPEVVQELVIKPRNELEHEYRVPSQDVARHAVGIADLFIRATQEACEQGSIVAVGWNAMGSHALAQGREHVQFREFSDRPMLFIDVFDRTPAAKIVDPTHGEVRSSRLSSFTSDQAIELAQLLQKNYSFKSLSRRGAGPTYFQEMKRQAGF
jgi:hypothetical protein